MPEFLGLEEGIYRRHYWQVRCARWRAPTWHVRRDI